MSGPAAPPELPPTAHLLGWGLVFFGLWLVLIGAAPKDMPVGLVAAAAATWTSTQCWPPGGRVSIVGLARFMARFLPQAVVAGVDVAWRALSPLPALKPGLVVYRATLAPGFAQDAMRAVMSLQPGKLPVSTDASGDLLVHCLDRDAPVNAQLAADEAAFLRIWQGGRGVV